MSFIERMMEKSGDPKKGPGEAERDELLEESAEKSVEKPQPDALAAEGFIPGIDGDLSDRDISDFEDVDEFGPEGRFVDQSKDGVEQLREEAAVSPEFDLDSEPRSGSPDMAFANALSRHEEFGIEEEDAGESSPPVGQSAAEEIQWDTQPDLLMPHESASPREEEEAQESPQESKPVELQSDLEWPDEEPVPEPIIGDYEAGSAAAADDDPLARLLAEQEEATDESVPIAASAPASDDDEHIEAVGDEIGLPPETGKVARTPDLDDLGDFDDFDDLDEPLPVKKKAAETALPKTAVSSKPSVVVDDLVDEFGDEYDEEEPLEPRRVGNHVNLDLEHLSDIGVITPDNARGKVAEEYRLIKRPLLLNIMGEGEAAIDNPNIIMVSSSLPGEGKTFTSVNLAMSMAMELDRTVLLVDADVAKPSFSRVFDMETEGGLIDVLLGDATLEEVLLTTNVPKLRLLPAGRRHVNSVELLASEHMKRLTNELATRYENRIIVFDSPPLLATTEAGVLASLMSQIVLVVEANKTPQYVVQESLNILDKSKYIGLVLNKSRSSGRSSYYYDYRYPYYYGYGQ